MGNSRARSPIPVALEADLPWSCHHESADSSGIRATHALSPNKLNTLTSHFAC